MNGDYSNSQPIAERINKVNSLYDSGNIIKIFTARGSKTGLDWKELTIKQLRDWGIKHNELILGKPDFDLLIDDKAIHSESFIWEFEN